jgi:hypothetical protein
MEEGGVLASRRHPSPPVPPPGASSSPFCIICGPSLASGRCWRRFHDVHDVDTFWAWVELALEPAIVDQYDAVGNALPHSEWGFVARYNKVGDGGAARARAATN